MKILLRTGGILFLLVGLSQVAAVVGGMVSRTSGATDPGNLAVGFAFHAICMGLGAIMMMQGRTAKQTA